MIRSLLDYHLVESHSLRSAWIEIEVINKAGRTKHVALLTECVDRNKAEILPMIPNEVALLTECVDRNLVESWSSFKELGVALLTECVDRNIGS